MAMPSENYYQNFYGSTYYPNSYRSRGGYGSRGVSRGGGPGRGGHSVHRKLVNTNKDDSGNNTDASPAAVEATAAPFSSKYLRSADGRKLVRNPSLAEGDPTVPSSSSASDPPAISVSDAQENTAAPEFSASRTAASSSSTFAAPPPGLIRTKTGNLVSFEIARKLQERRQEKIQKKSATRELKRKRREATRIQRRENRRRKNLAKRSTLCRFFQKTGVCKKGKTCPYLHDYNKVAICPRSLSNSCPRSASTCPLSHDRDPHRMPHCTFFPRCKAGDSCIYPHVDVGKGATICRDFVQLGWCERGLDCSQKHLWECPEFSETGRCSQRSCKLPHVLRRRRTDDDTDDEDDSEDDSEENDDEENAESFGELSEGEIREPKRRKPRKNKIPGPKVNKPKATTNAAADRLREAIDQGQLQHPSMRKLENSQSETGPKHTDADDDVVAANASFITLVVSSSDEEDGGEEEDQEDQGSSAGENKEEEGKENGEGVKERSQATKDSFDADEVLSYPGSDVESEPLHEYNRAMGGSSSEEEDSDDETARALLNR